LEGTACLFSLALPVFLMGRMGLVGTAVGFFLAAVLYAVLLVCLLCRGSAMQPGMGTVNAVFLAALAVCACQWLGGLSDELYFGLLPTTLAAVGCFWCYRRIIAKEDESRAA
jgi:hypothetical protein